MAGYLSISDAVIDEGDGRANFTVTLSGAAPSETVTLSYGTIRLTANSPDDYDGIMSERITFLPGETSKTISIDVNDDKIAEPAEYFSVRLFGNSPNSIITKEFGIGTVVDNDTVASGLPYISADDAIINESDGFVNITVRLNAATLRPVSVNYTTVANTGIATEDFISKNGTLTFMPGETAKTVRIDINNDRQFEPEKSFFLELSDPLNGLIANSQAEIRIAAHTQLQAIPLVSVGDAIVDEAGGIARFEVTLSAPTSNLVEVLCRMLPGTIEVDDVASNMSEISGLQRLRFEPGESVKTIDIAINDDADIEDLETFGIFLTNASNATIAKNIGLGVIIDNDLRRPDGPRLIVDDVVVNENDGIAEVLVHMDAVSANVVTVNYATIADTARAGTDFVAENGTLTFLPGETSQKLRIGLIEDNRLESDERLLIRLSNASNATIGHELAEVRIAKQGAEQSIPLLSVQDITVGEADGLARVELRLSAAAADPITVSYFASPQPGLPDYTLLNTFGTLTFMPDETVKTVPMNIIDDSLVEGLEAFAFSIGTQATNVQIVEPVAIVTISDNDTNIIEEAHIVTDDAIVNEGDGYAGVTVRLSAPADQVVKVNYRTVDGSARAGSDFIENSGVLTFLSDETAKTIRIDIIDDKEAEFDEQLFLQLSDAAGAALSNDMSVIRISNSDRIAAAQPSISISDVTVSEYDRLAKFEVKLSAASTESISFSLGAVGISARLGSDFGHAFGGSIFSPGETVRIVTVGIGDDIDRESTETFELRLTGARNATIADAIGIGTIFDNDSSSPAGPRIVASDVIANESDGYAAFAVNLNERNAGPVTVMYQLVNGTARVGADVVSERGTLTFLPGDTSETVRFRLLDDLLPEKAETFSLRLFNASGAQFVSGSELRLTGTINDNDAAPYRATLARESFVASATVNTVDYVLSDKLVAVNLTSGRGAGGYAAGDTFGGIANLYGSAHNDRLTGDAAINVFDGRAGNDILKALGGDDQLQGNVGDDRLDGGTGDDLLRGGVGNDFLIGGIGDDSLLGDAGEDRLVGGAGNDRLIGGAGNDIIDGGIGVDILTGNTGIDVFVFNRVADGVDIVTDFTRTADVLSLANAVKGFDGTAAAAAGFVAFTVSGRDTILRLDANGGGDGFLDLAILKNVTGLTVGVGLRDGWLDLE